MTSTPLLIPCDACHTEGRIYTTRSGHANDPDTIELGPCDVCDGTGREEIKGEVLELEDLDMSETDYLKYRGKCKELAEAAIAADPTLALVRGHYHCPFWGEQAHWWAKRPDGTIVDPAKNQFPSKGIGGTYVEFDGSIPCSNCGKEMREDKDEIEFESRYAFCSTLCHGRFVGVF